MNGKKKIFLITILSLAFIFVTFSPSLAASDTPLTDQANVALQKAEADLATAKKALTPAVQLLDALVKAKAALVEAKANFNIIKTTSISAIKAAQAEAMAKSLNDAFTQISSAFPLFSALSPPATQTLIDHVNSAQSAIAYAGNTSVLNNYDSPDFNTAVGTAITTAITATNLAIAVAPPAPLIAPIKAAIDAAEAALAKAKAAIGPAADADAVTAKTSEKGLKADAAKRLNPAKIVEPAELVGRFIKILLAFIGSISLVLYIFAGILWMTASGASERVDKAKKILVWTTLGVVVMLASYMLVSFVFKSLRL